MSTASMSVVDDRPRLQHGSTGCGNCEFSLVGDKAIPSIMSAGLEEGKLQHKKDISASAVVDPGCTGYRCPSQNGDRASASKQRHEPMTRPRETRASQLRIKSHSVTETNSPQRRQSDLKREKMTTSGPNSMVKDTAPRRLKSRSTSSDDNSDITESTSDRGSDGSGDPKSTEHWNGQKTTNQTGAPKSATSARLEFAESHHMHGLSGPAAKTQPPPAKGLISKAHESADSSQQNQNKSKSHVCPSPYGPAEKYLTPLQQKERHNKELNVHVDKLQQIVHDRDDRIKQFEDEKQEALDGVRKVKDTEIGKLLIETKKVQMQHRQNESSLAEMTESLDDERRTTASMNEQIETMKKEHEEREAIHQKRYLDMYQKGREAQLIDQEEDLICMAIAAAPDSDGKTKRLVKKLEQTEQELEKLRQTFREDVYHKSPVLDTDSAAQVEILKSAVYYYLTDTQPEVNLKVMLSMLNYSDVQKRNIISHLKKKKSK